MKVAVYMNVLVMLLRDVTCAGGADYKARDTRDTAPAPPLPPSQQPRPGNITIQTHHTVNICYIEPELLDQEDIISDIPLLNHQSMKGYCLSLLDFWLREQPNKS